jgi:hypothetical protein
MRVEPKFEDWKVAKEVYRLFSHKPGSAHIASELTLAHLAVLVRTRPINSVIEFGAGIGTVTYLLLSRLPEDRTVVSIEHNTYCLEHLMHNIPPEMRQGWSIRHPRDINGSERFDLLIADGKHAKDRTSDCLQIGGVCFVDGDRAKTRATIETGLAERGLTCAFVYHSHRSRRFEWRRTVSGFPYPRVNLSLSPTRGCWIGEIDAGGVC